jgi:hypothetical protein
MIKNKTETEAINKGGAVTFRKKVFWSLWCGVVVLGCLLLTAPGLAAQRSDWILTLQSLSFEKESVFTQTRLPLQIPVPDAKSHTWTSRMKLFNCDVNFSDNKALEKMSICYNFGAFNGQHSSFYDPDSPYFCAHYGVYALAGGNDPLGITSGQPDMAAIADLVAYDQLDLVLESLGCPSVKKSFRYTLESLAPGPQMAGFDDWIQIDASISTNAPLHQAKGFHLGYLQYGWPPGVYNGPDFPAVPLLGRLYLRYDASRQVTIIYFVIAPSQEVIETTSQEYLKPIVWPSPD